MVPDPGKTHKTKIGLRRLLSITLVKNGLDCDRFPLNLPPAAIGRGTMLHSEVLCFSDITTNQERRVVYVSPGCIINRVSEGVKIPSIAVKG
jgi:hypothetical protein